MAKKAGRPAQLEEPDPTNEVKFDAAWKTIRQGGLRGCILDTRHLPADDPAIAFTKRERTRLVAEFDDMSRVVTKWNYWMHRVLLVTLTLGADKFLQDHGLIEEPQDAPEYIWGYLANGELVDAPDIQPIPIQDAPLPLILNIEQPNAMRPALDNSMYWMYMRLAVDPAEGTPGTLSEIYRERFSGGCFLADDGTSKVDFAEFWDPFHSRGRFWSHMANNLWRRSQSQYEVFVQKHMASSIKQVVQAIGEVELDDVAAAQRTQIVERTIAFLNPRHLLYLNLDQAHPLFTVMDNAQLRIRWIAALQPCIQLLLYILEMDNDRVLRVPNLDVQPLPEFFPTVTSIYQDASRFKSWDWVLSTRDLVDKCIPFFRWAALKCASIHGEAEEQDDEINNNKRTFYIPICPLPTQYRKTFVTYDYRALFYYIYRPSLLPWQRPNGDRGLVAIPAVKWEIARQVSVCL